MRERHDSPTPTPSLRAGLGGAALVDAVLELCSREPREVALASVESVARSAPGDVELAFAVAALRLAIDRELERKAAALPEEAVTSAELQTATEVRSARGAAKDRAARSLSGMDRLLDAFPKSVPALLLGARCHHALGQSEAALKCYRRASVFAAKTDVDADDAARALLLRTLDGDSELRPYAQVDVWRDMVRSAEQSHEPGSRHSFRARVATDLLAKPSLTPELRRGALETRARECLAADDCELAVGDLEALFGLAKEDGQRPRLALCVGYARALFRLGRSDEALQLVRETVAADDQATGAFLSSLDLSSELGSDAFTAATSGLEAPPSRSEVELGISRCQALHQSLSASGLLLANADASLALQAVVAGNRCLAGALARGETDLVARALQHFGLSLVFSRGAKIGLPLLLRARQVAAEAFADEPLAHAEIVHALAVGYLWSHQAAPSTDHCDAAGAAFEQALELRRAAEAGDAALGQSYGDLARLAVVRGDERAAEGHRESSLAHLRRASLPQPPGGASEIVVGAWSVTRLDALGNLAIVAQQHAVAAMRSGLDAKTVLDRIEAAIDHGEAARAEGIPPAGDREAQLRRLLAGCRGQPFRGHSKRVAALIARLSSSR